LGSMTSNAGKERSNNALELSVMQGGPRLSAARSLWPAAQRDR
jgi:hypothetical protein